MRSALYHSLLVVLTVGTLLLSIHCVSVERLPSHLSSAHRSVNQHDSNVEQQSFDTMAKSVGLAQRIRRGLTPEAAHEVESVHSAQELNPTNDKRPWATGNNMAVWGKRDDVIDDNGRDNKRKWSGGNMAVWGKRKWASGNMAVWGKRSLDDEERKRSDGEEEEDESLHEKKRKWSGERNMAVWG